MIVSGVETCCSCGAQRTTNGSVDPAKRENGPWLFAPEHGVVLNSAGEWEQGRNPVNDA
jgi:hypothetical protein